MLAIHIPFRFASFQSPANPYSFGKCVWIKFGTLDFAGFITNGLQTNNSQIVQIRDLT